VLIDREQVPRVSRGAGDSHHARRAEQVLDVRVAIDVHGAGPV
jgi:hypothetical protein